MRLTPPVARCRRCGKAGYPQKRYGLALFLLGEGEALGEARGWGRLTAACLQQRIELLVCARRPQTPLACLYVYHSIAAESEILASRRYAMLGGAGAIRSAGPPLA